MMLNWIRKQKIISFDLKAESLNEAFHLTLSIILFLTKFLFSYDSLEYYNWLFMVSIFFKMCILIFFKRANKLMASKFYLIYMFSTLNYLMIVYLTYERNSLFLNGIETMIAIYFNFQKIEIKSLRIVFLGMFGVSFLRKTPDFEIDAIKIIYLLYILFMFEISMKSNYTKKKKKKGNKNLCLYSGLKSPTLQKFCPNNQIKIMKNDNKGGKNESYPQKLLAKIKLGIIVINKNFKLTYANKALFEIFGESNLEKLRIKLFSLEEEINDHDFLNIPTPNFQNIFKKIFYFSESPKNSKFINFDEDENFVNLNDPLSKENLEVHFKNWDKRKLIDHISGKSCSEKEGKHSVLSYLQKLFHFFKQKSNQDNPHKNNYSMFVNYKSSEDAKNSVLLINFNSINEFSDSQSTDEILITIRKVDDLEIKFLLDEKWKQKFESFFNELREPIYGIMTILSLFHAQNVGTEVKEEQKKSSILKIASIGSQLLLNGIDDFIDYFSICNGNLKTHLSFFDFQEFFNEILHVFHYLAEEKGLNLLLEMDKNIPKVVYNDQYRLRRILCNILSNFSINIRQYKFHLF